MSCKLIYHVVLKHKHSHTFGEEIVLKVEANTLYEAFVRSNFECLEKYPNYELSSISPPSGLEEKRLFSKIKNTCWSCLNYNHYIIIQNYNRLKSF